MNHSNVVDRLRQANQSESPKPRDVEEYRRMGRNLGTEWAEIHATQEQFERLELSNVDYLQNTDNSNPGIRLCATIHGNQPDSVHNRAVAMFFWDRNKTGGFESEPEFADEFRTAALEVWNAVKSQL